MNNERKINFFGGVYNESIQVQGNFVQGDQTVNHNYGNDELSRDVEEIRDLLKKFQQKYSSDEAVNKAAHELVTTSSGDPQKKRKLLELGKYVASNGGIEAGIGKVIDLALKLLLGI